MNRAELMAKKNKLDVCVELEVPIRLPKHIQLRQVPVDQIIGLEAEVHNIGRKELKSIRRQYESTVKNIMRKIGAYDTESNKPEAEAELFRAASMAFFEGIEVPNPDFLTLAQSTVPFLHYNCYTSSVTLADALCRKGKSMMVIITKNHVLLCGNTYAFQTTDAYNPVFPLNHIDNHYADYTIREIDQLLNVARWNAGVEALGNGDYHLAARTSLKAARELSNMTGAWFTAADALCKMSNKAGALAVLDRAILTGAPRDECLIKKAEILSKTSHHAELLKVLASIDDSKLQDGDIMLKYTYAASAQYEMGKPGKALSTITQIARQYQNNPYLTMLKAKHLFLCGRYEAALKENLSAERLSCMIPEIAYQRAKILGALKKTASANILFATAINLSQ